VVAVASDIVDSCFRKLRLSRSPCHGWVTCTSFPLNSRADEMDKDNRDDFTFAKLSDLKVPVTLRMSAVFVESIPPNSAQESRIVHSSKDPGWLVLSPNFWKNRS